MEIFMRKPYVTTVLYFVDVNVLGSLGRKYNSIDEKGGMEGLIKINKYRYMYTKLR
jgi:hypothetical protein